MKSSRKIGFTSVVLIFLSLGGYAFYTYTLHRKPLPEGLIQANGRIEGDHVTVASKFAGRIQQMQAHEGESVTAGQVLAVLDDAQVSIRVSQAKEAQAACQARVVTAETELSVLKKEVPLAIETARAGVSHAQALVAEAEASRDQAERDSRRFKELVAHGTANRRQGEQADLALAVAEQKVAAAHTARVKARKQLAQTELGWEKIQVKVASLEAIQAQCQQSKSVLAEARSVHSDMTITAPISGVITTRVVNQGEVVAAGSPLFDLVDMDRLYLKVYVAEDQVGKLRRGLPARIYTDAFPDRPFEAEMRYIASRAEFTPKEVQTPDERVKLVFAAKLYLLENPDQRLTPGMPADAVIRWKEDAPWAKPQW